ncbi:hypothetical protein NA57DRAFT_58491 [Rhizodiscina lignyota]|uniref:Uncharacterized protein n=1 Tax=Rhizodiscina lignyota TaxID=1504668 RepID=A0A9P4IDK1_9PEZI|nr:hypothetical protein NA57DRAFT_58491 [Rhizodiscina lignyota]
MCFSYYSRTMSSETRQKSSLRGSRSYDATSSDDDDDPGRTESQQILANAKAATKAREKDEFAAQSRDRIQGDSAEFEKLITDRSNHAYDQSYLSYSRETNDISRLMDAKIEDFVRMGISAVSAASLHSPSSSRSNRDTNTASDSSSRFLFSAADSVLKASARLMEKYANINELLKKGRALIEQDIQRLTQTGKAIVMRRLERVVETKTRNENMNEETDSVTDKESTGKLQR